MCRITQYNTTYEDTIKKVSVNLPLELYAKMCKYVHCHSVYGGMLSVYIRQLLETAVSMIKVETQIDFGF